MSLDAFIFEVDFGLNTENNLCWFAFSEIQIRNKIRHSQGENSFIYSYFYNV